jgi:hypothetical protein
MKRCSIILCAAIAISIASQVFFTGHTQTLPAPKIDRVGFKETFTPLYTFDNFQNRQIRAVWGNSIAASVQPGQSFNFPYGSVLLFESYSVQQDTSGEPVLDEDGKFIPTNLTTIFVMRKEKGFGRTIRSCATGSGSTPHIGLMARPRRRRRLPAPVPSAI